MKRVVVHIDRLALHGLAPHEARAATAALHAALHAELGELLGPDGGQFVSLRLDAAPAQRVDAAPGPDALGRAAAGAVAAAIGAGTGGNGR